MGGWIVGFNFFIVVEFFFFLVVLVMVVFLGKDLFEFDYLIMILILWIVLVVGFIVVFIVLIIVMEKFVNFLKKKLMRVFVVYRIIMGVVFVVLVFINIISV